MSRFLSHRTRRRLTEIVSPMKEARLNFDQYGSKVPDSGTVRLTGTRPGPALSSWPGEGPAIHVIAQPGDEIGRIQGDQLMKTLLRAGAMMVLFAGSALALSGERMAEIPLEQMTPAQRTVAEAIMSGPRKSLSGPFNAWLRSPEL